MKRSYPGVGTSRGQDEDCRGDDGAERQRDDGHDECDALDAPPAMPGWVLEDERDTIGEARDCPIADGCFGGRRTRRSVSRKHFGDLAYNESKADDQLRYL